MQVAAYIYHRHLCKKNHERDTSVRYLVHLSNLDQLSGVRNLQVEIQFWNFVEL